MLYIPNNGCATNSAKLTQKSQDYYFSTHPFVLGIQRDTTIADKLMYIPYNYSQNYPLYMGRLDTQLNAQTNQNLIKAFKVLKPANKKTLMKL